MRRRTFSGLLPLFPIALFGRRQEPIAPPAMPIEPVRSGPTMDQLINLADRDPRFRGDYDRVLTLAIQQMAPVVVDTGDSVAIYHHGGIPAARVGYLVTTLAKASATLVPDSVLPYFRPEHRGEEFPPGIPFKRLP